MFAEGGQHPVAPLTGGDQRQRLGVAIKPGPFGDLACFIFGEQAVLVEVVDGDGFIAEIVKGDSGNGDFPSTGNAFQQRLVQWPNDKIGPLGQCLTIDVHARFNIVSGVVDANSGAVVATALGVVSGQKTVTNGNRLIAEAAAEWQQQGNVVGQLFDGGFTAAAQLVKQDLAGRVVGVALAPLGQLLIEPGRLAGEGFGERGKFQPTAEEVRGRFFSGVAQRAVAKLV